MLQRIIAQLPLLTETAKHSRGKTMYGPATFVAGFLTAVLIPYIHIGVVNKLLWVPDRQSVDRDTCTCSCWDAIFKGSYETTGDSYKHLFFNATSQTLKIWALTVFFLLAWYESVRRLLRLIVNRNIRTSMVVLFVSNIYPLYYSWWSYVGYYNDDFYNQFYHQLFFTVTELISVVMVIRSCDQRQALVPRTLLFIMAVSTVHLILGGVDQFVMHLLFGDGRTYQRSRDTGFVIADVLHVTLPAYELVRQARSTRSWHELCSKRDARDCAIVVATGLIAGHML